MTTKHKVIAITFALIFGILSITQYSLVRPLPLHAQDDPTEVIAATTAPQDTTAVPGDVTVTPEDLTATPEDVTPMPTALPSSSKLASPVNLMGPNCAANDPNPTCQQEQQFNNEVSKGFNSIVKFVKKLFGKK